MDKYLLQILHEVNTIIIPGLGALTVTNKASGEVMFMSYLKHDDGNLVRHIVEKEGLSENDAKNLIAKYVREIQAKLDTGDSYDMYQFGRFVKKDGDTDFESWNSYQHSSEEQISQEEEQIETPVEKVTEEPKVEEKVEIVEEVKPEQKVSDSEMKEELTDANDVIADLLEASTPATEESPKSLDDILNVPSEKVEEKPLEEIVVEKVEIIQEETIEIQNKPDDLDTSLIAPTENVYIPEEEVEKIVAEQKSEKAKPKTPAKKEKAPVKPKVVAEKAPKQKKSKKFWILTILALVLVAGGATTAIFYDKIEPILFGKKEIKLESKTGEETSDENLEEIEKQVALEQEATEENSTNQEEATNETTFEPIKEKVVAETKETPVVDGNLTYHIIAGSFGVEANANRLAKKYSDSGKKSVVLGKFDDMYLVSYEAFATKEEAMAALKNSDVKGWVFKYPK